ncbi:hypothetical protein GA0070616_3509 [Micromonospora nigra]|uniref:Uncharacterized protein n=1 Tax=Micromonospora nigra TaxID=145857 RepID=A0A1C6SDP7_9ACTN|nr:hypothetical protein GA0070616_3509 [Micromonospora nigra]
MGIDARVGKCHNHTFAPTYLMSLRKLKKLEMPLISTNLAGTMRCCRVGASAGWRGSTDCDSES